MEDVKLNTIPNNNTSEKPLIETEDAPGVADNKETTPNNSLFQTQNQAQAIPAQEQLPADSYLYANTSHMGGIIQSVAKQYDIDPHKLEALTNTIRTGNAELSGFYDMQIGYYPGMTAESLVTSLGRVADLSNAVSQSKLEEANAKGEAYDSSGIDELAASLVSKDNKKSGQLYYQEALTALQEADNVEFDTDNLTQYYEALVQGGASQADAWTKTMNLQDKFRAAQDQRAVMQDIDKLVIPADMSDYATGLYEQVGKESDPETKIRLYNQYQAASKLANNYASAYKADPAGYLQVKDKVINASIKKAQENGDYSETIDLMNARYDAMGVAQSERKYLSKSMAESVAKEINTNLAADPAKAQSLIVSLNQNYGRNFGDVISQLIRDKKLGPEAKILIEATKTGAPATNNDVLDMLKNKFAYKGDYAKTMLNAPDVSTAKILMQKIEKEIYKLPGYKAVVNQLNLTGNTQGKIELAQYYANMAAYYKYKMGISSDREAAKLVQKELIDSIYDYDEDARFSLQQRTLNGRPILYNNYTSKQAGAYLGNRLFTNQNLQVGGLPQKTSERLLGQNKNIQYITVDQFTVQPVYVDDKGTMQSLFKLNPDGTRVKNPDGTDREYTINLKHLGDEDILGTFEAQEVGRNFIKALGEAVNAPSIVGGTGYVNTSKNTARAVQTLAQVGFTMKHFDTTKPLSQQLDRTNMSIDRIKAYKAALTDYQNFEKELSIYRTLQKNQRDTARYFTSAAQLASMMKPFISPFMQNSKENKTLLNTFLKNYMGSGQDSAQLGTFIKNYKGSRQDNLPDLKKSRERLYALEDSMLKNAAIFLDYKGALPIKPLTKQIQYHNVLDNVLWGGYGENETGDVE